MDFSSAAKSCNVTPSVGYVERMFFFFAQRAHICAKHPPERNRWC
jgi:hypothetical protein